MSRHPQPQQESRPQNTIMSYTTMDDPTFILVSHKSFDVLISVIGWIACCFFALCFISPLFSPETAPSPPSEPSHQYTEPEPEPVSQLRPFPYHLLRPRERPEPTFEPQPVLQSPPFPYDFLHPRGPPEPAYEPSYEPSYERRLQPEPVPLLPRISNGLIPRAPALRGRLPRRERHITQLSYRERQVISDRDESNKKRLDRQAEANYLALKVAADAARAQRAISAGGDVSTVPVVAEKDSAHEKPVTTKAKGRHVRFADDVKQSPTTTGVNGTVTTEITSAAPAGTTHDSGHETGHIATKPTELSSKTAEPLARAAQNETAHSSMKSNETPLKAEEPLTQHSDIAAAGNSTRAVEEQVIPYQAPANELMQVDIRTAQHTLDVWLKHILNAGIAGSILIHYWTDLYTVLNFWLEWITCTTAMKKVVWDFGKLSYEDIGSLHGVLDQIQAIVQEHRESVDSGLLNEMEKVFVKLRKNMNQAAKHHEQEEQDRLEAEQAAMREHIEQEKSRQAEIDEANRRQQIANAEQQRRGQEEAQLHQPSMQPQQQEDPDELYIVSPRTEKENLAAAQLRAQKARADAQAQNTSGAMQVDEDEANLVLGAQLQKEFDQQNFEEAMEVAKKSAAPSSAFGQQPTNPFAAPPPASDMQQPSTAQPLASDQQSAPQPACAAQPPFVPQPSAWSLPFPSFHPTPPTALNSRPDPIQRNRQQRTVNNRVKNMNAKKATTITREQNRAHAVVGPVPQLYKTSQAAQTPAALGVLPAASIPDRNLRAMATNLEQTNNKVDEFERVLGDATLKNMSLQERYIYLHNKAGVRQYITWIENIYMQMREACILSSGEYCEWNNKTLPASKIADARLLYRMEKDHDFLKKFAIEIKDVDFGEGFTPDVRNAMDEAYMVGSCLIMAGCRGVFPREYEGEDEYYHGTEKHQSVTGVPDFQAMAPVGMDSGPTSTDPDTSDFL